MWNWNQLPWRRINLTGTFNRTNVELKFKRFLIVSVSGQPFNRTNVELKFFWIALFMSLALAFNRTNVELKLILDRKNGFYDFLLIVPMWNWNMPAKLEKVLVIILLIVPMWNWNYFDSVDVHFVSDAFNRTNVELKLLPWLMMRLWLSSLLIVPMWNWNGRKALGWILQNGSFNRTNVELKYSRHRNS